MTFTNFKFHPTVSAGVSAAGFTTPTPIQKEAIPAVMKGQDVMGLAQTGTGKTAAFALPILDRLVRGKRGQVRALVVAPTRELAEQIHQAFEVLGKKTGLKSMPVYGGVGINPQKQKLKRGVEIVVACPGRLLDHLGQRTVDLSQLEVLVLDEADHMFDMGFLPDIRRIIRQIPSDRQTLLFSATMPAEIRHLADDVLKNPSTIQIGITAPAETVRHALYPVAAQRKTALLLTLLRNTDTSSVLVFTRTKHRAKKIGEQLAKAGYRSTSLQGNLSQGRRQAALEGFRSGRYQILVATDIAARGIDVSRISHVINYDIPATPEAYIHRIGRTGRAANTGDAFTLVTTEDAGMANAIDRVLGSRVERRMIPDFDYGHLLPTDTDRARKTSKQVKPWEPAATYAALRSKQASWKKNRNRRSESSAVSRPQRSTTNPHI
ncbi:MAG: DEAD/DEAH box helicase [Desulfobacteraceae bacterium]|jgi:ATP-dependent RNA helicase RhlE|nr:DEAD/DEAH box helicase [Desulfobacteraceae bacterium]